MQKNGEMINTNELMMRCEICNEMDSAGRRGKACVCKVKDRVIPDIRILPWWCPFYDKYNNLKEKDL